MAKKGSVMLHVLVMGVIMGLLAAGMMSVMVMQYRLIHREAYGSRGKMYDELALSILISAWRQTDSNCNNMRSAQGVANGVTYSCTAGTVNTCSCNCVADSPWDTKFPIIRVTTTANMTDVCSLSIEYPYDLPASP